jgi:hypothetical protein
MKPNPSFVSGRHLAAARTLAGLKQTELAKLAGLHVSGIKRLEGLPQIQGSDYAITKIGEALLSRGVLAERWPVPFVRIVETQAAASAA